MKYPINYKVEYQEKIFKALKQKGFETIINTKSIIPITLFGLLLKEKLDKILQEISNFKNLIEQIRTAEIKELELLSVRSINLDNRISEFKRKERLKIECGNFGKVIKNNKNKFVLPIPKIVGSICNRRRSFVHGGEIQFTFAADSSLKIGSDNNEKSYNNGFKECMEWINDSYKSMYD